MTALADRVTEKLLLESRGSGRVTSTSTLLGGGSGNTSVSAVDLRAIHRAYLEDDDAGTLLDACLTSMEDNATTIQGQNPKVEALRQEFNAKEKERVQLESEFENLLRQTRSGTPTPADLNLRNVTEGKLRMVSISLSQIDRQIAELTGSADRTALLRFCRSGMDQITRMIARKMELKAESERLGRLADLCKSIFSSSTASEATKAACLRAAASGSESATSLPRFTN